jgi:hypothetical protein
MTRKGLRFAAQSTAQRAELEAWLTRRFENILPERVLDKFRGATSNELLNASSHRAHLCAPTPPNRS